MKQSHKAALRNLYVRTLDILSRDRFAHARHQDTHPSRCLDSRSLQQPFLPSATLEAKKHNLRQAALRINQVVWMPGEIFSFWHIVGNPNDTRRFKAGRSIHAGVTTLDIGGGLCQASGIIHHLALITGLDILERHNHSVDLYTEQTRFAPIGTDATVFFGFKDLRLRNNLDTPLRFHLHVGDDTLTLTLIGEHLPPQVTLHTAVDIGTDGRKDVRITDDAGRLLCRSCYLPEH